MKSKQVFLVAQVGTADASALTMPKLVDTGEYSLSI